MASKREETVNGNSLSLTEALGQYCKEIVDHYGLPFGQSCVVILYALYKRLTVINVVRKFGPLGNSKLRKRRIQESLLALCNCCTGSVSS